MKVDYDSRAVRVDGHRTLILCGAMHYPRSTPEMWPGLMRRSREAGLNTVETYVFWNLHERHRGVYDFSGRLDLAHFCHAAAAEGLHVIVRIGPYICGETNYGGFPTWLREIPGMEMRTWNEPFMREMACWCRKLMEYIRPLLASNGGPIILVQFENEFNNIAAQYGDAGRRYLQWCVELGASLGIQEPMIMCAGGAEGAIETINSFYLFDQLEQHWEKHPEQPAISTEFYTGWYETWGYPRHTRDMVDMGYSLLRFIAAGGSGVNYYMWHGGTNFGREGMYLQAASYDFDCPLDESGLPTTKYHYLARIHHFLLGHADRLLATDRARPRNLEVLSGPVGQREDKVLKAMGGGMPGEFVDAHAEQPRQVYFEYGEGSDRLVFLCNDDTQAPALVTFEGQRYELAPQSVAAFSGGKMVLNSAMRHEEDVVQRVMKPLDLLETFESAAEPLPGEWPEPFRDTIPVAEPMEQLQFTQDQSDYCWYSAELPPSASGPGLLRLAAAADLVHVFVDGVYRATTPTPLMENRNLFPESGALGDSPLWAPVREATFEQTFTLLLPEGARRLDLLCVSLGLVKGDWMLGLQNMVHERKGLWGPVSWTGEELSNWTIQPGLLGERQGLPQNGQGRHAETPTIAASGLRWWWSRFQAPEGDSPLFLDLAGMTKGLIYLNGRCLSRYWLLPASGEDPFNRYRAPVMHHPGHEPTQRYYHVPRSWVMKENDLVLLEEIAGDASRVSLVECEGNRT